MAMRKIAGAFKTTPIAALEAELGLPSADLGLDRIQRAFTARLFTLPENHPLLPLCPKPFPRHSTMNDNHHQEPLPHGTTRNQLNLAMNHALSGTSHS